MRQMPQERLTGPIQNIVIVGGGTSGWLTAAYLDRMLNHDGQPRCALTLIESSDIGTIGVGEATIPTLGQTMAFLGIEESEWMPACNATYKLAVKFAQWTRPTGEDVFYHLFGEHPEALPNATFHGIGASHLWLSRYLSGNAEPFAASYFLGYHLCEQKKSPNYFNRRGPSWYAYHLDAGLLGQFLKRRTQNRVRHLIDQVVDVELDNRGWIHRLHTGKSGPLEGDLFIDCSGFRGLLINQALKTPFLSYEDHLLCDRAIAMQIPNPTDTTEISPYTTATALKAGWSWNIPLYNRVGTGYVYSSQFISDTAAEEEFRKHLGPLADGIEARPLRMRVGRTANAWVNNCIAIGLSGGFIEPLESTGIYLTEMGLMHLRNHFPSRTMAPTLQRHYNQLMQKEYEEIRNFLILHYVFNKRGDTPFWLANAHDLKVPEDLQVLLDLWKERLPEVTELAKISCQFNAPSYTCLLAGNRELPQYPLPRLQYHSLEAIDEFLNARTRLYPLFVNTLPGHKAYLQALYQSKTHDGSSGKSERNKE